jgi:hypothetical protein
MTWKDRVEVATWFDLEAGRAREGATSTRNASSHHALRPREFRYRERGEFFSNRVVRHYNELPNSNTVKQSATINAFKNSIDEYRGIPRRTGSRPTDPPRHSRR